MNAHRYQSSYLAPAGQTKPSQTLGVNLGREATLLRRRAYVLWRLRPNLPARSWYAMALWAIILSVGLTAFQYHSLPAVPADVAAADGPTHIAPAGHAQLASVAKAPVLPGGPTDQLLPPGSMAPIYTYPNTYARGQCTWYVAGRRPIPSNWGNANSWYTRAKTAGWGIGTTPAIAAIAWTAAGPYGHVALVEDVDAQSGQVLISEMNYRGLYQFDKRWVAATDFKYIY